MAMVLRVERSLLRMVPFRRRMDTAPASLAKLAPEWSEDLLPEIRHRVRSSEQAIVVLDDDPTGTQTVYDTPVLTEWSEKSVAAEFEGGVPLFYILTNSRSMSAEEAARVNREVAASLLAAKEATGRGYTVISRSDSTLRGHYPVETDVLAEELGETEAVCLLIPFFLEGGRWTIDDTHYVVEGDRWTLASETPFAKDAVFGFEHSHLPSWVEEKTVGKHSADAVGTLDLATIRQGPDAVAERLLAFPSGSVGIVNALTMRDIEVVVAAILDAEVQGKRFLYRTAASFVRARAGLAEKSLLAGDELVSSGGEVGGLVVVGSYVPKTTKQLDVLLEANVLSSLEIDVAALLAGERPEALFAELNERLGKGESCVVYTSRNLIAGSSDTENLGIGQAVTKTLVDLVKQLPQAPRYLVAKGGITSSDLATKALGMRRALVKGQILPGIPVWEPDENTLFPGLPFVVFPGNVGSDTALLDAIRKLNHE